MKEIGDITLEELMAEEFGVTVRKNPKFGYNVTLIDEDDEEIIGEGVHPYAIESFASLCRRFLSSLEACDYAL